MFWGGNCAPDVIIEAKSDDYDIFDNYFKKDLVNVYFQKENYKYLFPFADTLDVVNDLQEDLIKLHLFKEDNKEYYIGLPKNVSFDKTDSTWVSKTKCIFVFDKK